MYTLCIEVTNRILPVLLPCVVSIGRRTHRETSWLDLFDNIIYILILVYSEIEYFGISSFCSSENYMTHRQRKRKYTSLLID